MVEKKPTKKEAELKRHLSELTIDLQRTRADFENYRKRADIEKEQSRTIGKSQAILKLLPVIDNIERAISHLPDDLKGNVWALSVNNLVKQLDTSLEGLDLHRIDAVPGVTFNPELHEAIQFDDTAEGEHEIIAEELQSGYKLGNGVIRHAMVKVTRK